MTVRLLVGDCRETLATLEPGSIQSCITSPPYYGLRDYGTPPLVWGQTCCEHTHNFGSFVERPGMSGGPSAKQLSNAGSWHGGSKSSFCSHIHDWQEVVKPAANGIVNSAMQGDTLNGTSGTRKPSSSGLCACGAWLGSLGLEPSPELYIEHVVECFRAVWRVLRPDGTLWVNLGDSYAGSGKGPSNSLNKSNPHSHEAGKAMKRGLNNRQDTPTQWMPLQRIGPQEHTIGHGRVPGLKPKDLMMIPARAAIALQADGWTLRAQLPWLKRNCMPGSEKDRPTNSVEYFFLLSKSRRYFWDYEAARRASEPWSTKKPDGWDTGAGAHNTIHRNGREKGINTGEIRDGRNWRTSDQFFDSWQGLLTDEDGEPQALVVNPRPFKGSHFATFPPKVVEPLVKASTRPGDTILDPFSGAGTVGLVADRLDRNAVLCELSDSYGPMAAGRIVGDSPMFAEVVA